MCTCTTCAQRRMHAIAEQAAQEWEATPADTYDRGFLAGVHQALTFARTHGTDIGDELYDLIERADTRERHTIPAEQLPGYVGWYVRHPDDGWRRIIRTAVHPDGVHVYTDMTDHPFTGWVTVLAPLAPVGEPV